MSILLFAAFAIAGSGIVYALLKQRGAHTSTLLKATKSSHVHTVLGFLMAISQASEIANVFSHVGALHLLAALFLSAIWIAVTREPEEML